MNDNRYKCRTQHFPTIYVCMNVQLLKSCWWGQTELEKGSRKPLSVKWMDHSKKTLLVKSNVSLDT